MRKADYIRNVTPLHLQIMIHYHCSPTPYGDKHNPEHANSPAVTEFTQELFNAGFIEEASSLSQLQYGGKYISTEAGGRWLSAITGSAKAYAALLGN
jgi:hypothetical protein